MKEILKRFEKRIDRYNMEALAEVKILKDSKNIGDLNEKDCKRLFFLVEKMQGMKNELEKFWMGFDKHFPLSFNGEEIKEPFEF